MQKKSIEVVFFDLGRVIVDFNHFEIGQKLLAFRQSRDHLDPRVIFDWVFDPRDGVCCAFDAGQITSHEFYEALCEKFDLRLSYETFSVTWNEIFSENKEVTRLIRELSGQVRLFLLSNTNPLNFEYIRDTFPVIGFFEGNILSYEVGACKPDPKIYEAALNLAGVHSDQALYTDDIAQFIHAAGQLGIQGIHFTSAASLKENLARLIPFRFSDE